MKNLNEIRSVATVAKLGTLSGAARELSVHRATVQRHVEFLEELLQTKLFVRHARGYTPTEPALKLVQFADRAEADFNRIIYQTREQATEISGEITITALEEITPALNAAIIDILGTHPDLRVRFLCSTDVLDIDFRHAQIALRVGERPNEDDYIVRNLCTIQMGLYASKAYAERFGVPASPDEFRTHHFAGPSSQSQNVGIFNWFNANVPPARATLLSNSAAALEAAVLEGVCIGFLPTFRSDQDDNLFEVLPPHEEWRINVWLVTHIDLRAVPKVRACFDIIKDRLNSTHLGLEGSHT
ncbi:MAG: LysR family transcriptional regulator [Pseudomonadota bacterium]